MSSRPAQRYDVDQKSDVHHILDRKTDRRFGFFSNYTKRFFDITASILLLWFFSPLFALIALGIKLTSNGPILYRQRRTGRFKRPFLILKFRTMSVCEDCQQFSQAKLGDPRITTFGAFLRRTSLDELPQLWNVLNGDMSLVGPRPHAIAMDETFAQRFDTYDRRFLVRPGITGLAQAEGYRGETDTLAKMKGRLERDLRYIKLRSFKLDLQILLKTFVNLFSGDAY